MANERKEVAARIVRFLFHSSLTHSPRSGREVEPNGERRRQGAEREEPNDRGAGWMTVKGAATRGLFVWPITVIPALSVQPFLIHFGPFLVPSFLSHSFTSRSRM